MSGAGSVPGMIEVWKVVKGGHSQAVGETASSEGTETMGVKLGAGLKPKEPGMIPMAQIALKKNSWRRHDHNWGCGMKWRRCSDKRSKVLIVETVLLEFWDRWNRITTLLIVLLSSLSVSLLMHHFLNSPQWLTGAPSPCQPWFPKKSSNVYREWSQKEALSTMAYSDIMIFIQSPPWTAPTPTQQVSITLEGFSGSSFSTYPLS